MRLKTEMKLHMRKCYLSRGDPTIMLWLCLVNDWGVCAHIWYLLETRQIRILHQPGVGRIRTFARPIPAPENDTHATSRERLGRWLRR